MLTRCLLNHWYRDQPSWLAKLLCPLECIYRFLAEKKKQQGIESQATAKPLSVPVIVVGNITVGGVGKTPVVLALVKHLQQAGYKPGIISRGYQGRSDHYPLVVTESTAPKIAGDEPVLLAKLSGCPVVVDPNRPAAAQNLSDNFDVDIILSDDGLQHYPLARDIEIVVIDGERGLGNEHCLPSGPLREPVSRLYEVDGILVNGGDYSCEASHRFKLVPSDILSLKGTTANITEKRVHGIAAIGNPDRFFNTLRALGFDVIEHPFPDHHHFTPEDFFFDDALPILMTAKDAVKCQTIDLNNGYYLPVEAELPHEFLQQFDQCLRHKGLLPFQD